MKEQRVKRFNVLLLALPIVLFPAAAEAEFWQCTSERFEFIPDAWDEVCVFRDVQWKRQNPEPDFLPNNATKVAFVRATFGTIPNRFFAQFPQLEVLIVRESVLDTITITDGLQIVRAENSGIRKVSVDGGRDLRRLYLRKNGITNIRNITEKLPNLEVLDLSETNFIAESTINLQSFSAMRSLKELYLINVGAHYVENENDVTIPELQLLDISENIFTPRNFHLSVFKPLPNLQELYLRNSNMNHLAVSDIREDLPALRKIFLTGNYFTCNYLQILLNHLKERNVEAPAEPQDCPTGHSRVDGFCCVEVITTPKYPVTTLRPVTVTPGGTTPGKDVDTKDAIPIEETPMFSLNGIIMLTVIIVLSVIVVGALVVFFVMRRMNRHNPVPMHDNATDNL